MRSFLRFCTVGIVNTLLSLTVFYILCIYFDINYILSSITGYAIGTINSFIVNSKWTFKNKEIFSVMKLTKFIFINCISALINIVILFICVKIIFISKMFSQIIAVGFSTITNYFGSKIFVFKS